MMKRMLAGMKDQHAPLPVRHCSAVDIQKLSMNAHFTKGGTILKRRRSVTMVRRELKTPLNRFVFIHRSAPILMTGAFIPSGRTFGSRGSVMSVSSLHKGHLFIVPVHEQRCQQTEAEVDDHNQGDPFD